MQKRVLDGRAVLLTDAFTAECLMKDTEGTVSVLVKPEYRWTFGFVIAKGGNRLALGYVEAFRDCIASMFKDYVGRHGVRA